MIKIMYVDYKKYKNLFLFIIIMRSPINLISKKRCVQEIGALRPGATIRLYLLNNSKRSREYQTYQGVLISLNKTSSCCTITIRRFYREVSVEQNFALNSTAIRSIRVVRHASVRRSKLYYLRALNIPVTNLRKRLIKLSIRS
jgi:large subunit ribosomal protein L19